MASYRHELPKWLSGKEFACYAGDMGLILGWRRSPGEGNGNPIQYSCLGNPMDRGAWWATVHEVRVKHDLATKPQPPQQPSNKRRQNLIQSFDSNPSFPHHVMCL